MVGLDAKSRYQFKRMLEELEGKRGRGTELISVYIPPDFDPNKVVQQLRDEQGTASNIKSKTTRKNVLSALERIIQFLRTYIETHRTLPLRGLVVFCGNVAGRETVADIKLYWVEPPEPITIRMYRCDQEFVLEPLKETLQPKETTGLVTLDRREATIATLKGKHVEIIKRLTSGVPGKHGKGGQSARRFERLVEIAAQEFMKRVAEGVNEIFSQIPNLRAIIIGGPGPTKEELPKSSLLYESLRKKIAGLIDIGYTDEQGIKELINKSGEVLTGLEIMEEKNLMQRFLSGLVKRGGLVAYGEEEIRRCLQLGAVDTLIISEDLRRGRVTVRCGGCGYEFKEITGDVPLYERHLLNRSCPSCGEEKLSLVESRDLVQELCGLADQSKARVEFISSETEEGKELLKAFKGLAALLRFRPS